MVVLESELGAAGKVRVELYDADVLDSYQGLSDVEKISILADIEPLQQETVSNITCIGLSEWIVDSLNAAGGHPPAPESIELGRSNTTPQYSDTALNDPVDRVSITSYADEGEQIRFTTLVGESEGNVDVVNGETLSEVGVWGNGLLLNHALFNTEYEKDETKTMTVEVVLSFTAA